MERVACPVLLGLEPSFNVSKVSAFKVLNMVFILNITKEMSFHRDSKSRKELEVVYMSNSLFFPERILIAFSGIAGNFIVVDDSGKEKALQSGS